MAITRSKRSPSPVPTRQPDGPIIDEKGFKWGPWSVEERRVVYEYLNTWISHHGLDAFITKKWTKDEFTFLANTINEVNAANKKDSAPRSVVEVSRQVRQLYGGRLGPLAKLSRRSEDMKLRVELGHVDSDRERFPEMAIPVPTVVDGVFHVEGTGKENVQKRVHQEVDGSVEIPETRAAKKRKEKVIKLSVDWTRLHVGRHGQMEVLRDGEVWDSPMEDGGVQESPLEEDGSEPMSTSEAEEGDMT